MNRRIMILVVITLVVWLALGGWWLAQAASHPEAAAYRLETGGIRVVGVSSGAGYRLELPGSTSGGGTPCCCAYIPCIWKVEQR